MTTPPPSPPSGPPAFGPPPYAAAVSPARTPWAPSAEVRAGLVIVVALLVAGVLGGLVWLWWSPPRGIALALGRHTLLPDESEAFVAADGRYAVVTGVLGLAAGLVAWWWRAARGAVAPVALLVGCGLGAGLTATVGRVFGGGVTGAATQQIVTPPLALRATGLLALEAAVALFVYGISVTLAARDDLARRTGDDDERGGDAEPDAGAVVVPPAGPGA